MKAATFASVLAVSLAGVACSEKAPADAETAEPASESSQPEQSEFNLRYPTGDSQPASSASSSGEFNLRVPDGAPSTDNGVRLPEGAVRDDALSEVPEVQGPNLPTGEETPPAEDAPEESEDEIIRLD